MAKQKIKTGVMHVGGKCYVVWNRLPGQSRMKNKAPDYLKGFDRFGLPHLTCPKCLKVDVTKDKWWIDYGG